MHYFFNIFFTLYFRELELDYLYSTTLIDNILTNNISTSCDNGLIINDLSNHLPIFTLCYTDAHTYLALIHFLLLLLCILITIIFCPVAFVICS